jgi:hypothetical protein
MRITQSSRTRLLVGLCAAAFVTLLGVGVGCSKDDVVGDATAEAVEAGLNNVLNDTVEPLASFFGAIPTIVSGGTFRNSFGGVTCPDTSSVCGGGGSVVCTPSGGGTTLTFDFDQCAVVTGDQPFTLDGVVIATPGDPILLTFQSLFIDNHPAISGTGSVSVTACSYVINVTTTDDASVVGTVFQCDADPYPTAASHLTISFGDFVIDIGFDGSSVAHSVASNGGNTVANCDINLAADPLTSSCSAP